MIYTVNPDELAGGTGMTQEQADQLQFIYDKINVATGGGLPNVAITVNVYCQLRNYSGYLWSGNSTTATFYIINGVPEASTIGTTASTSWVQNSGYQSGTYDIKYTLKRIALIDEDKNELDIIFAA